MLAETTKKNAVGVGGTGSVSMMTLVFVIAVVGLRLYGYVFHYMTP